MISRSAAVFGKWRHVKERETLIHSDAPSAFLCSSPKIVYREMGLYIEWLGKFILCSFLSCISVHARCCCHVKQSQPLSLFCSCWQLTDFIFVWWCFLPNYSSLLSSVCLVTSVTSMMPRSMSTASPLLNRMASQYGWGTFLQLGKRSCALSDKIWLHFLTGSFIFFTMFGYSVQSAGVSFILRQYL